MAIDYCIEDFNGKVIEVLYDDGGDFSALLASRATTGNYAILKYIDPYDDTVLNSLMVKDFMQDLRQLQLEATSNEQSAFLLLLIDFAQRALAEPHLYLRCSGD